MLAPVRRWSTAEVTEQLDPEHAVAVFDSPEVAIDPVALAAMLRRRIADEPLIELRTRHRVESVKRDVDERYEVVGTTDGDEWEATFDQVVNALWGGRIAVDETLGLRPGRPWLHRLRRRQPAVARPAPGAAERDGDLRAVR